MLRILVLVSGGLGLKSLQTLKENNLVNVRGVFTDYHSTEIIGYCENKEIPIMVGNPRKFESDRVEEFKKLIGSIDILFSINYLFIIDEKIIEIPQLYALNIHGSLLPKYRGRTPHVWSIINGEEKTGITVHKIHYGVDTGDILLQKEVEIGKEDTGAKILEKFSKEYPVLIDQSISLIQDNQVDFKTQDDSKATYYGKRTPQDGQINWNWDKFRIRNWVRAQAAPYPGAFTYNNTQKIIINKLKYSDLGYSYEMENGKVLSESPLTIKTCNGALEVLDYKIDSKVDINLKIGDILK